MFLGYNTNGFAHHRLADAIGVLAELGYEGIALTPDVHHLDPFAEHYEDELTRVNGLLLDHGLYVVVETGARFLLDPLRKHQPTLIDPQLRQSVIRVQFLMKCVDMAADLGADVLSFWSGAIPEGEHRNACMARLISRCKQLADYAAEKNVKLAFEPEPGMLIETMDQFSELYAKVNHPSFGLTLDIGHLICMNELPVSKHIKDWKHALWNIHIEDMKAGIHDHVMFGYGDVNFDHVMNTLNDIQYPHGVYVELSRHSHNAVVTARNSLAFLRKYTT